MDKQTRAPPIVPPKPKAIPSPSSLSSSSSNSRNRMSSLTLGETLLLPPPPRRAINTTTNQTNSSSSSTSRPIGPFRTKSEDSPRNSIGPINSLSLGNLKAQASRRAGAIAGTGATGGGHRPTPSLSGIGSNAGNSNIITSTISSSKTDRGREFLGTAVSNGWSAFSKARSVGGQAISNFRSQNSGSSSSIGSSWNSGSGSGSGSGFGSGFGSGTGSGLGSGSGESSTALSSSHTQDNTQHSSTTSGKSSSLHNQQDGPFLTPKVIKRKSSETKGKVFGKDVTQAARDCPCVRVIGMEKKMSGKEGRNGDDGRNVERELALPAVAIRCVDHLTLWTPQEEGIFRIPGRSTHVTLLRNHFDMGGDVDLEKCDPGDVDPHAVASVYRSYLRELPTHILTPDLAPIFDTLIQIHTGVKAQEDNFGALAASAQLRDADSRSTTTIAGGGGGKGLVDGEGGGVNGKGDKGDKGDEVLLGKVKELMGRLPLANRWLLQDLAKLLAWTSQHSITNKMTLQNLLMVFCPSINLSPPFLKLLVMNHQAIFDIPQSSMENCLSSGKKIVVEGGGPPVLPTRPKPVVEKLSNGSTSSKKPMDSTSNTTFLQPTHEFSRNDSSSTPGSRTASRSASPSKGYTSSTGTNTDTEKEKETKKFSTPIADRFARASPPILDLRIGAKK